MARRSVTGIAGDQRIKFIQWPNTRLDAYWRIPGLKLDRWVGGRLISSARPLHRPKAV